MSGQTLELEENGDWRNMAMAKYDDRNKVVDEKMQEEKEHDDGYDEICCRQECDR